MYENNTDGAQLYRYLTRTSAIPLQYESRSNVVALQLSCKTIALPVQRHISVCVVPVGYQRSTTAEYQCSTSPGLAKYHCSSASAPPVAKLEARIQWIKLLGGSTVSRIRRFNMYGMSILRYWAHLLLVPRDLLARERTWHSKILGVPHNSVTAGVVSMLMGRRCRFPLLSDIALISSGMYSARSPLIDRLAAEWQAASHDHEVSLARYGDPPPSNSLLARALETRAVFQGRPELWRRFEDGSNSARLTAALVGGGAHSLPAVAELGHPHERAGDRLMGQALEHRHAARGSLTAPFCCHARCLQRGLYVPSLS